MLGRTYIIVFLKKHPHVFWVRSLVIRDGLQPMPRHEEAAQILRVASATHSEITHGQGNHNARPWLRHGSMRQSHEGHYFYTETGRPNFTGINCLNSDLRFRICCEGTLGMARN